MAAFSITGVILSPSNQCRLQTLPLPVRGFSHYSFSLTKTHSTFPFPVNKYLSIFNNNTMTSATLIIAAPPQVTAATTADSDVHKFASASITSSWAEFAENVSGEWDGFGADFTVEGKPIELPESVVPEAYREWEVKVFDWQTQCPTLAQSHDNGPSLKYKTVMLLPTVGCEADAATTYSIQERDLTAHHYSPLAYQSTGCYVALWPVITNQINGANKSIELEHCLIDPRDKQSRVRIIQVLELQESALKLQNIRIFVEQWYGPFRNGDQLGGCAIRDSAFAATQPLKGSQVSGVWQGLSAVATFPSSHSMIQQLGTESVCESIRSEGDLILLPKQLWCSVTRAENNETCCEVGWLLDEGRAITSKCTFSSTAKLKEIAIACETAVSA
ncbi:hypothetical protein CDL12_11648 [Handroanthus impetiginosus]|uniref:Uncharacterized protein n=1 Tax=Handroanthus impetiginosus TaxID=429701 RepID=A0A2G9HDV8_9LAMI|nr:hypothetical protein CDL12_11648 [Handroanthus impetiginosus]